MVPLRPFALCGPAMLPLEGAMKRTAANGTRTALFAVRAVRTPALRGRPPLAWPGFVVN